MSISQLVDLLVIEDEDAHWDLFRRHLRKATRPWTRTIDRATTLQEAKKLHKEKNYGAVILDLNLPDSSSNETILKGLSYFSSAPVLVLTSLDDDELGQQAVKNGAQEFLAKEEINPELLRRSTAHAIERFAIQQRLSKKNQDLEMYAKMLAHEIRNPLHIVMLTLNRLQFEEGDSYDPETQEALVSRAIQGINDIDAVISELLALVLADGIQSTTFVDADEILRNTVANLEEKINFPVDFTIKNPISRVVANGQQLKQIFDNLLGNAIRYRCYDRPLSISVHSEEIHTSARFCRIYITDNGVGIRPEDLPQIFEPLFRGRQETPREGTGLGLYYCKTAIEKFGGKIDAVSRYGKGSTFILDLPLEENSNKESA